MQYHQIAVIGMSGRFAQSETLLDFRRVLSRKQDCIAEVSEKRKRLLGLEPDADCIQLGSIEDIDCFDHKYFGIPSKEADFMSPEQRLGLELATEAVLNAGYSLEQFRGKNCGVLVSSSEIAYNKERAASTSLSVLGNMKLMICGKIAYFLDLRAANAMYDAGCSSSLAAIHDACMKLMTKEWEYALVGGISLFTDIEDKKKQKYQTMGLLSPEYRSKAFDEQADGTSAGEGAAFVLLKRLKDAERDGDFIYGVLTSGAVNGDGARCSKVTMPSPEAQRQVIERAWRDSGNPELTEIEAHGIGNKIGDSVEAEALFENLRAAGLDKKEIYLSAVKTNIGHLYEAAGVASLVKVLLGFRYDEAYPLANFQQANALIDFASVGLAPLTETRHFSPGSHRVAGIDGFGISGTNVHVLVENYANKQVQERDDAPSLVKLSAQSEESFYGNSERFAQALRDGKTDYAAAVYTMNTARDDGAVRRLVYCDSKQDLLERLDMMRPTTEPQPKKLVFVLKQEDCEQAQCGAYETLFPGMRSFWKETDIPDLTFKCAAYRYFTACGMTPDYVLADKAGKAVVQYAAGRRSIEDLQAAANQTDNDYTKVVKQLEKLAKDNNLLVVDFGHKGALRQLVCLEGVQVLSVARPREMAGLFVDWYNNGKSIDWEVFYQEKQPRVCLPGYAFEKCSHWITPEKKQAERVSGVTPSVVPLTSAPAAPSPAEPIQLPHLAQPIKMPHLAQASAQNEQMKPEPPINGDGKLIQVEQFLEKLWMKILNFSDSIAYDEDFFYLGGNSLLIEMMADPIDQQFGIDFDIYEIYENETIEKLAHRILETAS